MPSASHRWCARCHKVRVDKRAAHGMCQRCKRIHKAEIDRNRRAVRTRRAQRLAQGVADMPETAPPPVPNGQVNPSPISFSHLSDDRKLEIGTHYANYQIPVVAIVRHYKIPNGELTRIADELGIPRRDRRNVGNRLPEGYFTPAGEWRIVEQRVKEPEPAVPEDTLKALEKMITPILPPAPEPPVPHKPTLEEIIDTIPHAFQAWVEGRFTIEAQDMLDAIQKLREQYPNLRVTEVKELY